MTDVDLSLTVAPKSDQLNADDLIGGPRTIKITRVSGRDNAEQPIAINFDGDNGKPFLPCKTMRRLLIHMWKERGAEYVGRRLTLYCDPDVQFGGLKVGGIRISHASHIERELTYMLTATRGNKKPTTVKPLGDAPATAPSKSGGMAEYRKLLAAAAEQGTAALRAAWEKLPWNDLPPGIQDALTSEFAGFKETATKADAQIDESPPHEGEAEAREER